MYLVQKQDTAVAHLHNALPVSVGARKAAFVVSKQLRQKQLRIVRIVRAVKCKIGRILAKVLGSAGKTVHQLRQIALSNSGRPIEQTVQTLRRIENRRLGLGYLVHQTAVIADKVLKDAGILLLPAQVPVVRICRIFRVSRIF